MKVTIIGWNNHIGGEVEVVTNWPDDFPKLVAVARASRDADVQVVEKVLVEEGK